MNKKIGIIGTLLAAMTLMAVFAVVPAWAADPTNATTTVAVDANTSYSGASAAGSAIAKGGNITEVDVTVASQTQKWQGFYGNVSGGISLKNAGATSMYDWSGAVAGEVFASQDSIVTAAEWAALTNQTGAYIDSNWSFTPGDADSAANTFTVTSTAISIGSNSISAADESAVKTKDDGAAATWETIALGAYPSSQKSDFVFASLIRDNSGEAYDGTTKDFQMIVPVGGSTETYYFYVELT